VHDGLHIAISKQNYENTCNILTVVPEVMDSSLAVLITLIALKSPMWCVPLSNPVVARANVIQKQTIATKSMRVQLCLRYGTFLCDLSRVLSILSWNGRAIASDLSERKALEKNVDLDTSRRVPWARCAVCIILSVTELVGMSFVRVTSEDGKLL
jgi:hypothetical protein